MMFLVACALASLAIVSGAIEKDKVTSLPGYKGNLPSTHYSGCKLTFILQYTTEPEHTAPVFYFTKKI